MPLLIEVAQYATGRRWADVDDLILNTAGAFLAPSPRFSSFAGASTWGAASASLGGFLPDLVNHAARRIDRQGGAAWDVRLLHSDHDGYLSGSLVELAVRRSQDKE